MQKVLNISGSFELFFLFFKLSVNCFLLEKRNIYIYIYIYVRTFPYSVRNEIALFMQGNSFQSFTFDVFE